MKFILAYSHTHHYILIRKRTQKVISSFYDEDGMYTILTNIRILERYCYK
jgi:hypothetical protein